MLIQRAKNLAKGMALRLLKDQLPALSMEQVILSRFYEPGVGQAYGVGRLAKDRLIAQIHTITEKIPTATSWLYHVVLAQEMLSIPPEVKGDVIECGCWKGGSTASLSLVCQLVNRKLLVCDSFQGLPRDTGKLHWYPHISVFGYYKEGMYASPLEEVRANITKYGSIKVCQFIEGFYKDSLKQLSSPIAFAFLDVDLASSLRDCIQSIWPLLIDGGKIYTDDSCDMEVVKVWFDETWWLFELGVHAPGYVGSGCGLALSTTFSSLGYATKVLNPEESYKHVSWLYYPDKEK